MSNVDHKFESRSLIIISVGLELVGLEPSLSNTNCAQTKINSLYLIYATLYSSVKLIGEFANLRKAGQIQFLISVASSRPMSFYTL